MRTSIPCRKCSGPVVIFLIERALVCRCSKCGDTRPAKDASQSGHLLSFRKEGEK